jgi:hypothetical protein
MSGIKLHHQYGLNPTISTCFWCGEEKNELALLGAKYPGKAPKNLVLDYHPCDTCASHRAKGITLIACTPEQNRNEPPIQRDAYPTGAWAVVSEDYMRRVINSPEALQQIIDKRMAFVEPDVLAMLVRDKGSLS